MLRTIVVVAVVWVAGCFPGAMSSRMTSPDDATEAVAALGEVFPVSPGFRWTLGPSHGQPMYIETAAGPELFGHATTRLKTTHGALFGGSQENLVYLDDKALWFVGWGGERLLQAREPAALIPLPIREESTWQVDIQWDADDVTPCFLSAGRLEAVDTGIGLFNAWPIRFHAREDREDAFTMWLAPGVGIVKLEGHAWYGNDPDQPRPAITLQRLELIRFAHRIRYPSEPQPLRLLPARVRVEDDAAILFADFNDRFQDNVVVYIINNTGAPLVIPHQDNDLYIKQEALIDGKWQRVQTHHYSWCGNSYGRTTLAPHTFVEALGRFPAKGWATEVRYSTFDRVKMTSNVGRGYVDAAEADKAAWDDMALKTVDAAAARAVLFGAPPIESYSLEKARRMVLERLEKLPKQDALPVLREYFADRESCLRALRALPQKVKGGAYPGSSYESQRCVFEVETAQRAFENVAPTEAVEVLSPIVLDRTDPRRRAVVKAMHWSPANVVAALETAAGNPDDPLLDEVLEALARTERSRALFQDIAANARYTAQARTHALFLATAPLRNDPEPPVDPKVVVVGPTEQRDIYSEVHIGRFTVRVTLRNEGPVPVTLPADDVSQVATLFLSTDDGHFLAPRPDAPGFFQQATTRKTVVLAPGAEHTFDLDASRYYDLPQSAERPISLGIQPRFHVAEIRAPGGYQMIAFAPR